MNMHFKNAPPPSLISELAEAWQVCSGAIDTPMSLNFTFFPRGVESAKTEHEKHHYIPSIKYRGMLIAIINKQLNPLKGSGGGEVYAAQDHREPGIHFYPDKFNSLWSTSGFV